MQIIIVHFAFTMFSFLPNEMHSAAEQLLAVDPSYCASYYSPRSNYPNLLTQHGITTRFADLTDIPGLHNYNHMGSGFDLYGCIVVQIKKKVTTMLVILCLYRQF